MEKEDLAGADWRSSYDRNSLARNRSTRRRAVARYYKPAHIVAVYRACMALSVRYGGGMSGRYVQEAEGISEGGRMKQRRKFCR